MSWPIVKLEDVFEIVRGGSPRPIDQYLTDDSDGLNWISIKDASNSDKYIYKTKQKIKKEGLSKSRLVNSGDFLLTNSMSFGRPYIMKTTGCIHDGWLALRGNKSKVDPDYFYYLLGSDLLKAKFKTLAKGAVVKNLNINLVKGVKISLPPLETQKQIAAVLEKADQLCKDCQLMEQELNSLAQSVFIDMFGDPVSNPKGWNESIFSTLVKNIQGGQSPKCNTDPAKINEWGVLKLSAIKGGAYKPHENKAILEGSTPNTSIEVKAGDLLFTRKNTYELVGSCAYVTDTPNRLMLPDLIFRFEMPDHLKIYVWGLFNSREFKQTIKNLASGAAGSMPNISKTRLNDLLLPIPDAEEISKYTKLITGIWQQLDLLHQAQHEYEATFNTLMQKAFKGELNLNKALIES